MRKRLKKAILLLLAALASLLVLAGCELGITKEQALNEYNLKASVTYYANGGEFSSGAKFQEIWYKEDAKPIDLVNDSHISGTTIKLSRTNYKFLQWYHILETGVNEDGTPILDCEYDEKTKQYFYTPDKTRPVDFNVKLQEDEHWYICADWEAKLMVEVYLVSDSPIVGDDNITYYPIDSQEAQTNEELALLNTYKFINGVADISLDWRPVAPTSYHTFVGFYYDKACTQLVTEEILMGEQNVVLYAKYIKTTMVEVYLVSDSPIVGDDEITYYSVDSQEAQEDKERALLSTYEFVDRIADIDLSRRPVKPDSDHTFVGFYYDKACTQLVTEEIAMREENIILYAKYIEGEWEIIREADDVEAIFYSKSATDKFYFIQDIDMAGVTCRLRTPRETKCTVLGNGFTVKNLTINNSGKVNVSLFGAIADSAVIENLTFENVTCNWTFQQPQTTAYLYVYFVCASVAEGAKIENVNFTGELALNLNIPKENVVLVNYQTDGEGYKYTNCLFGGESDEAYTLANPNGFKVEGKTEDIIKINQ